MKNHPIHVTPLAGINPASYEPSDDEVRDYAFHLYQQNGCTPGRDVDNWLEATACLKANVPPERSHSRLQDQTAQATSRSV